MKEALDLSRILPSLLTIYSSEHSDTNNTGGTDNLGLVHQGVVAHTLNGSATAATLRASPEHKQAAEYSNTSVPASELLEGDSTFSVTAVRTMAWVIIDSPKINRSALFMFLTETPNTSSWLNLLESHINNIREDAGRILTAKPVNQQSALAQEPLHRCKSSTIFSVRINANTWCL